MFSLFVVKYDSVSLHNLDYPSLGICTVVAYDGYVNWGCFLIVSLVLWLAYSFVNMLQLNSSLSKNSCLSGEHPCSWSHSSPLILIGKQILHSLGRVVTNLFTVTISLIHCTLWCPLMWLPNIVPCMLTERSTALVCVHVNTL